MRTNYLLKFCFISIALLLGLNLYAQVPEMIRDINPDPGTVGGNSSAGNFFEYNGFVFFRADDRETGAANAELWVTDGTTTNTTRFDINPSGSSFPANYVIYDGKMYFEADNGTDGDELFVYDGTGLPTMVEDLNPGSGNSDPNNFVVFNGALYFEADNGTTGDEVYKYDGTSISLVADIRVGGSDGGITNMTVYNNAIYFEADNGTDSDQLFKIDASEQVTQYVINPSGNADPSEFFEWNGKLYFEADDGTNGSELWVVDGDNAPTLVADINTAGSSDISDFAVFQDKLYFRASDATAGDELFVYDGTNPPSMVADINAGAFDSNVDELTVFGNVLIFEADTEANGLELWVYNGTDAPTMLKDINVGTGTGTGGDLTVVNDKLYFIGIDATGRELWETDGTEVGTKLVKSDRINATGSAVPSQFFYSPTYQTLFFAATDGTNGIEPWRYVISPVLEVSQAGAPLSNGDTYNFAETRVTSSTEIVFSIANSGNTRLNISSIEASGDGFTVTGVVPTAIAAGGSEPVTVSFASTSSGNKTGVLTITSDDLANPSFEVNLSGLITSLEQIIAESLNIYPNPSQKEVQIDWAKMPFKEVTLQVRDAKGNALLRQTLQASQNTQSLDLSALPSGVYLVELITEQGRASRRIVKQ